VRRARRGVAHDEAPRRTRVIREASCKFRLRTCLIRGEPVGQPTNNERPRGRTTASDQHKIERARRSIAETGDGLELRIRSPKRAKRCRLGERRGSGRATEHRERCGQSAIRANDSASETSRRIAHAEPMTSRGPRLPADSRGARSSAGLRQRIEEEDRGGVRNNVSGRSHQSVPLFERRTEHPPTSPSSSQTRRIRSQALDPASISITVDPEEPHPVRLREVGRVISLGNAQIGSGPGRPADERIRRRAAEYLAIASATQ
jgi:hypothetical protein